MNNTRRICYSIERQAYCATWAYTLSATRWNTFYNVQEKVDILTMSGLWDSIRHQILEEAHEDS